MKDSDRSGLAQRFGSEGARQYDRRIRTVVPGYEGLHEMARSLLEHYIGIRARLLIVGSGTGSEIVHLGERNPGWRFTGVDPSVDMVSFSKQRLSEQGLLERVELHTGFTDELTPSDPYDAASLIFVMHFLPDDGQKLELLHSISARLNPGAPLILADAYGDETSEQYTNFVAVWKRWQLSSSLPSDNTEELFRRFPARFHFIPEERILELLSEAGFVDIKPFYSALLFGGWIAHRIG